MRATGPFGRLLTAALLMAAGFSGGSSPASAAGSGIIVDSVAIDSTTVDVTHGAAEIVVRVAMHSDTYYRPPLRIGLGSRLSTQATGSFVPSLPELDANNQTVNRYTLPIPQGSANGRWDLSLGGTYYGEEWVNLELPAGAPTGIDVVSTGADIDPPVLESLTLDPASLSTGYRQGTAHLVAHITDASGITGFGAYFHTADDKERSPVYFALKSGTSMDGVYEGSATFPEGGPVGTWTLLLASLGDIHGNAIPQGAAPSGMPQSITITTDPSPPPEPQMPVARGGDGTITASWQPPRNDGGSPLTGYVATLLPEERTISVGPTTTEATFDGLGAGEAHTISVAAVNDLGVGLDAVNYNPAYTWKVADAPTAVSATAGDASAVVKWIPPSWNGTTVTEYVVRSSPDGIEQRVSGSGASTATVTGLRNRTAYAFTVSSVNEAGRGPESAPSNVVTPYAKPDAPVLAAVPAVGKVSLSWTTPPDTGLPLTLYRLLLRDASGSIIGSREFPSDVTSYTWTGLIGGHGYQFDVNATNAMGISPLSQRVGVTTLSSGSSHYTPVTPRRVLDTRTGAGARKGVVGPGGTVTFKIPGLPTGTRAVTLNLTGVQATRSTHVTAYAAGSARPGSSNLNLLTGRTTATLATVPVSTDGGVTLYNAAGNVHLVADLAGSFGVAGAGFNPRSPTRVLDTRVGTGAPKAPLGAGTEIVLKVPGLPSSATAVVLNLTAVKASRPTYLTAFPGDTGRTATSNLNVADTQAAANLVVVPLAADDTVRIANDAGTVEVVADVAGYFSTEYGQGLVPQAPRRILDTRIGLGAPAAPATSDRPVALRVTGLPAGASAVALTVVVTGPTSNGHLTVYPAGQTLPLASNVNFVRGQTVSNHLMVPIGVDGTVMLQVSSGQGQLVADLAGVYVP